MRRFHGSTVVHEHIVVVDDGLRLHAKIARHSVDMPTAHHPDAV